MRYSAIAFLAAATAVYAETCPAPGSYDSQGRYSCNPAHQYPSGQTCDVVDGCYFLCQSGTPVTSSSSSAAPSATPSCAAPGSTDAQGRYSCNPAHQYPSGQTCELVDGCYVLKQSGSAVPSSSSSAAPSATPSCPAPGSSDSQGRYSCNPAHQYPSGQTCDLVDDCYFLCQSGKPISSSSSSAAPSATPSCPAPGSSDRQGRYSCNPAHQYPSGQTCDLVDGCYFLCQSGKPISSSSSSSAAPKPTPSCPAPGSSDSQGRYSCNPAHQYPSGQTCDLVDGCYFLCQSGSSSAPAPSSSYPAASSSSAVASRTSSYPAGSTSACPAPGSTDSQGRYSCNPAHQYPAGQTCALVNGCYYLSYASTPSMTASVSANGTHGSGKPTNTPTPYTGAASTTQAIGGLAAVMVAVAFAL